MANYNRVILIGNLTRDPEMSFLPSQTAVTEIGLAVNRKWKDQQGEQREETCFIDCRAYGKQAETLTKYVKKGSPILIEGRLQLDSWEAQDGTKRSKHRVIIERFQFLYSVEGAKAQATVASADTGQSLYETPAAQDAPQSAPIPDEDSDDIPF